MAYRVSAGMAALAFALSACGGGEDETTRSQAGSQVPAETVTTPSKRNKPKPVIGTKPYQDPNTIGMSFDDYFNVEVQGVRPLMTIDEVRAALSERGYRVGARTNYGIQCTTCRPGVHQSNAYIIEKGEGRGKNADHQFTPFFYIDEDKTQRLWGLRYERKFADPVYPPNMHAQFEERYGEASSSYVGRYDDDDPDTTYLNLDYTMNMLLPDGSNLEDTEQDYIRALLSTDHVPDADNRAECWEAKLKRQSRELSGIEPSDVAADHPNNSSGYHKETPWCAFIMGLEPQQIDWFLGARYNEHLVEIDVQQNKMTIELNGHFLHKAEKAAHKVREYQAAMLEAEAIKTRENVSLDDL